MNYVEMIEKNRAEKDSFFKSDERSPLTAEQKEKFTGLEYFPVKVELRFKGSLEAFDDPELTDIPTNKGLVVQLLRFGKFKFTIDGNEYFLVIYKIPENGNLMTGMKDGTSGKGSYGGGRFIKLAAGKTGEYILDFNSAYNPYCAYNENWTCAMPPPENWLPVKIEAGEKVYNYE